MCFLVSLIVLTLLALNSGYISIDGFYLDSFLILAIFFITSFGMTYFMETNKWLLWVVFLPTIYYFFLLSIYVIETTSWTNSSIIDFVWIIPPSYLGSLMGGFVGINSNIFEGST